MEWMTQLDELEEAQEFLDFFQIPYHTERVAAIRLPLLSRFRQNLNRITIDQLAPESLFDAYRGALAEAWDYFQIPGAQPQFPTQSSCSSCQSDQCQSKSFDWMKEPLFSGNLDFSKNNKNDKITKNSP